MDTLSHPLPALVLWLFTGGRERDLIILFQFQFLAKSVSMAQCILARRLLRIHSNIFEDIHHVFLAR